MYRINFYDHEYSNKPNYKERAEVYRAKIKPLLERYEHLGLAGHASEESAAQVLARMDPADREVAEIIKYM